MLLEDFKLFLINYLISFKQRIDGTEVYCRQLWFMFLFIEYG